MRDDWKSYIQLTNINPNWTAYTKLVVELLGQSLEPFFLKDRTHRTQLIKSELTRLGRSLKFKVYANRLPEHLTQKNGGEEKNREWLWDIHWYTEDKKIPFSPRTLPLVAEIEWENNKEDSTIKYSSVMYDFQKLVITNAEFRLMIFYLQTQLDIEDLDKYFEYVIFRSYRHFSGKVTFLLVAYFETERTFYFREIIKN